MIAIDTSSLTAYFSGGTGQDVESVEVAFQAKQAVLPPVVLCELLSDPQLSQEFEKAILEIPLLELTEGFWKRTGLTRAKILARGHKARLADSCIAQTCMDHHIPLITRDKDFRHFVKLGLKIIA